VRWHDSLDIGSVRLTERFLHADPPTRTSSTRARRGARAARGARAGRDPQRRRAAIGVAGTITSIAALALGLEEYDRERVHGFDCSAPRLGEQLERCVVPLAERRRCGRSIPSARR
jgi:exopolyphosphatase/guanosine-5'-triphosphate,3'-diphosphate pyrophosphatase